jgi:RHS repeat-associated protein
MTEERDSAVWSTMAGRRDVRVARRVRACLSFALVACLLAQLLPADVDIPFVGQSRAWAGPPATPPPPVNPAPAVRVVTSSGPTIAPANINVDTVWSPEGSPYVVGDYLSISASLTLLPGTVVKLGAVRSSTGNYSRVTVSGQSGQLLALGTPSKHVIFTSYRDDAVMGDTNGDGSATSPAPGDWYSIGFPRGSAKVAPVSVIDYTDIRYGGFGSSCAHYGVISVDEDSVSLVVSNSEISDAQNAGIGVYGLDGWSSFVGVYNSQITRSCTGVSSIIAGSVRVELVGNTIDADQIAINAWCPKRWRVWYNTLIARFGVGSGGCDAAPTRAEADIRFNALLGGVSGGADWSANWWGSDINAALPACMDPNVAASSNPPITTVSSTECPPGQKKVTGYGVATAVPALSASAAVLPAAVREAAAPRFGPVNLYTGALTYSASDLVVEDAGKTLTATRTYRSDRTGSQDAGPGWSTAYSEGISSSGGLATMTLGDGQSIGFQTDPSSGYVPAPGVAATYSADATGTTITTAGQTGYLFDAGGELRSMTLGDPGHTVTVTRSGGKPARITGVSGRYLSYGRDGGLLRTITDSTGRSISLDYTGGRLTSATGVDGKAETYTYDGDGRLTRVTTPLGRVKLAAGYDSSGRVAWVEPQGVGRATFDYDTANARTVVTAADGTRLVQEYDWAGRLVAERVEGSSGAIGGSGRHVVYDGEGRIVANISGVPAASMTGYGPSAPCTLYDGKGDPVLTVDPQGRYTASTFDSRHKPLTSKRSTGDTTTADTVRTYDSNGRMATVTDPFGKVWTYTYNSRGQLTGRTDPLGRTRTAVYASNGDRSSVIDEIGATTTYEHDAQGRVTVATDALGHRQELTYKPWDAPATARRPGGGLTTIAYNDDRQQVSLTDPAGGRTTLEYDTAGRVAATVDAEGGRTTTSYDVAGRPATVTDGRGSAYTRTYGAEGWPTRVTDPVGAVTTSLYDPAGRAIRVTDALGQITQTVYDRSGKVVNLQTPDGATHTYTWDGGGRQSRYTTPRGKVWATTYDNADRPLTITDPLTKVTRANYDELGRPATMTDQLGVVTTYAYNDAERSVTVTDPMGTVGVERRDLAGRLVAVEDGEGAVTTLGYNADGLITSQTQPGGAVTGYEYDLAGRNTAVTDPAGRRTAVTLNGLGRIMRRDLPGGAHETFAYDPNGNLLQHTDPTSGVWSFGYDLADRLTVETDPLSHETTYGYDLLGRATSVTDATGVVKTTGYDPLGRPAVQADVTGASWTTTYDLDGNVAATADPGGVTWVYTYDTAGQKTKARWSGSTADYTYTYDAAGRLTKKVDPYQTTYEFDARDRVTAQIDALGNRTTSGYDGAGRVTTRTPPSGHPRTWTYDAAGRLRTAADGLGNASTYAYDSAGQLARITLPRGGHFDYSYDPTGLIATKTDPLGRVTSFDYDNAGRLTTTTYPSGRVVTAGYDAAGLLRSTTAGTETRTFGYDDAGRLTSATSASGTLGFGYNDRGLMVSSTDALGQTTYEYDAAQRLTRRAPPSLTASVFTYSATKGLPATVRGSINVNLAYNNAGQITSAAGVSPSNTKIESRTYDGNGRLTTVGTAAGANETKATYNADGLIASLTQTQNGNPASNTTDFAYDDAGRLASAVLKQGTTVVSTTGYGWDADGNRTSVAVSGQPTVTTDFDLADQILSSSSGVTYVHDLDGNLTGINPGAATYAYNGFGELTGAITLSTPINYTRDAFGRVGTRTSGGVGQRFYYDAASQRLAAAQTDAGPLTHLVRDPSGMLDGIAVAGGTTQRVRATIHGDIASLYNDNSAGTTTSTSVYDPFGTASTTGLTPLTLGYQSMFTEPATGLVDMGFRSYSPATGRFTAADSLVGNLAAPVSLNRYLYANANPPNFYDPDGHLPDWLDDALDWLGDRWEDVTDWTSDIAQGAKQAVSDVKETTSRWAGNVDRGLRNATAKVNEFWDAHGEQIKAAAAGIAVGVLAFAGCAVLTAGAATPLCLTLAGAAGGAVYGGMTCPEGQSTAKCAAVGAVAGGVGGLTAGLTGGLGFTASGFLSGVSANGTDQLLNTGTIDPKQLLIAGAFGGGLGFLGGKLFGGRSVAPSADRPTLHGAPPRQAIEAPPTSPAAKPAAAPPTRPAAKPAGAPPTRPAANTGSQSPRFVASKQGIIDTEAPALRSQIAHVVDSMRTTGGPPPGVRQGGLPGKPGVYGNGGGQLPARPEGYYNETDVWPGTGPRGTERIIVGDGGEAWYTPDHYGTFRPWPW